ncbi:probable metal-nicotianamine transporter YSL7 [Magnolia sinica]|uniref:probable metal-nicotianamine transporter YSL7 n=1 Tax=Magnolia sinica TaxID=86752 RepID=UPI00265A5759|nr:probable metal-nicotianamine transporter YSL7 [Magnolia sinica]
MGRRRDATAEIAGKENEESLSTEQIFESKEVPSWKNQLTFRAFVVSAVLAFFFSFIVMKLNLTTGIIPSLNVAAGLLGFFFVKTWTKVLEKTGLLRQPFTRQENTVIQTCVVAASGIAFSGGFGSYMFGMSETIASQAGDGNTPVNVKNPSLGWMIGFLFVVSFVGLFSVVPLRKIMIIEHKLIYPSGTATAHLINSFHTPQGAKLVKKQVSALFKTFGFSFFWAFFQWFFTAGDDCGFSAFPTFGLKAYAHKFYFDFSATYVGVGMICPYIVNVSLLAGAILSWGIMWPLIEAKKGDWFSAKLSPSSLHGLQGYKVFISIAVILGDGLLHFSVVLFKTIRGICAKRTRKDSSAILPDAVTSSPDDSSYISYDDQRRTELFLKDQIPNTYAFIGYVILAIISIITVPHIFPPLKWYHVLVTYFIAPVMAFCNSYGCGLTDWSLASSYGKLAIFIFGAWIGMNSGGVLAGLASCGVMMSIVSTASDLMQDFKTGYLTLASPRSMFISQVIGTAMGCVIAPCVFWIFYKAFPLGVDGSDYPAPYATVYRGIALLGVEGVSSLPKNCLTLCLAFFVGAFFLSGAREAAKHYKLRVYYYMPSVMAMAIPFYLGSYFAIDMCLGSLILFIWEKSNKKHADAFAPAVASGMICGDGIWSLPASILALAKVKPPICMKFLSRSTNAKVDGFLSG